MATRVSDDPEVNEHYATQFGLSAALLATLARLWPLLDPENLAATFGTYRRGVAAVVEQFSAASVSIALDHYEDLREQHGARQAFTPPVIDLFTPEQLEAYIDKAAADLLDTLPNVVDDVYFADIMTRIQTDTEAAAQKIVADSGRNELIEAIEADKDAKGWARVVRPGACSFCRMLATRGPVYLSKQTANFRAHTNCHCTVEPLFANHYEPPAHTRADMALWERVTEGFSGRDKAIEFRRAVEGRMDGPRRPRPSKGDPKPLKAPRVKGQQLGFDNLTPDQLRHHLAIVEALPDSDYRTRQIKRLTDRLAALGA